MRGAGAQIADAAYAAPDVAAGPHSLPLCVDLDGTLVRTDTLVESLLAAASDWRVAAGVPRALLRGRIALKCYLAERVALDAASLPYNDALLHFVAAERERGRRVVLATAAHESIARAVSDHVGLFDEVIATQPQRNLKGDAKADALCRRFGERGFVYVGNALPDVAVWGRAAAAVLVDTPPRVARAARAIAPVEAEFVAPASLVSAAVKVLRPHQWLKNLLVFVPMITAGAVANWQSWRQALFAFAAFCCTASLIYLVNDLTDLAADRAHPRKRERPFASGRLPLGAAPALALLLIAGAVPLALASGAAPALAAYAATSFAYSMKLKERALVDVFCLAGLYTVRLLAGGIATGHAVSPWLMAFSMFLFVSLAAVKRVTELQLHAAKDRPQMLRRGYLVADLPFLQALGVGAGLVATLVLALYVQSDAVASRFTEPVWLWGIVALAFYWVSSVWLMTTRGQMHDDPIVFAARDRRTWAIGAVSLVCVWLAL